MRHRHVSHRFALYPGRQITLSDTSGLAATARKSLELWGDDGTGSPLAWKLDLHLGPNHSVLLTGSLNVTAPK
jgi:alpha-L-fucosidase 2